MESQIERIASWYIGVVLDWIGQRRREEYERVEQRAQDLVDRIDNSKKRFAVDPLFDDALALKDKTQAQKGESTEWWEKRLIKLEDEFNKYQKEAEKREQERFKKEEEERKKREAFEKLEERSKQFIFNSRGYESDYPEDSIFQNRLKELLTDVIDVSSLV